MYSRSFPLLAKKCGGLNFYVPNIPLGCVHLHRFKSTNLYERVAITDDGSTIVCWHPPKPFPYECSKPIMEDDVKPENTILDIENKADLFKVFKSSNAEADREELMKLTYTTKHRWFPNNSRFRTLYKRIKSDRKWL